MKYKFTTLLLILVIAGMTTGCSDKAKDKKDRWDDPSIFEDDPSKHKPTTRQL